MAFSCTFKGTQFDPGSDQVPTCNCNMGGMAVSLFQSSQNFQPLKRWNNTGSFNDALSLPHIYALVYFFSLRARIIFLTECRSSLFQARPPIDVFCLFRQRSFSWLSGVQKIGQKRTKNRSVSAQQGKLLIKKSIFFWNN